MFFNLRLLCCILAIVKFVRSEFDEYVNESRHQCVSSKNDLFSCVKYRSLSYLTALGQQYTGNGSVDSPVRLVKLQGYQEAPEVFPTARQFPDDSEFTKFFKFAKRQANYYLGTQGVAFDLPDGVQLIQSRVGNGIESRGKKKKATMVLMPLIILFKLFKIKIMVALVLASLVFIKKAIMLAALILPSIIQQLKHCGKVPYYHHQPHHHIEDFHDHDDFGGGGGGGYYGGYSKDYERAYNAYLKTKAQQ